jgi:hypothetical protein
VRSCSAEVMIRVASACTEARVRLRRQRGRARRRFRLSDSASARAGWSHLRSVDRLHSTRRAERRPLPIRLQGQARARRCRAGRGGGQTSGVLGGGVRELGFRKELVAALPDGAKALEQRAIGNPCVGAGSVEALGIHLSGRRGRPFVEIEGEGRGSWSERAARVASPRAHPEERLLVGCEEREDLRPASSKGPTEIWTRMAP